MHSVASTGPYATGAWVVLGLPWEAGSLLALLDLFILLSLAALLRLEFGRNSPLRTSRLLIGPALVTAGLALIAFFFAADFFLRFLRPIVAGAEPAGALHALPPAVWWSAGTLAVGCLVAGVVAAMRGFTSLIGRRDHLEAALRSELERQKRMQQALKESEERFRRLAGATSEAIVIHEEGRIIDANEAFGQLLGRELSEVIGSDVLQWATPETQREVLERIRWCDESTYRGTAVRADGTPIVVEISARNMIFEGRSVRVAALRDVTERVRAQQALEEMARSLELRVEERTAELERTNRELEAFAYSVSHDLKSPLRAIAGFSSVLTERHAEQLDAEGRRLLGLVRDNAHRMGQLIDDLLELSRIGRRELSAEEIGVEELVRAVFEELAEEIEGREVRLEIEPLPVVRADPLMMQQLFGNLVSNALKFTSREEPGIVRIGCRHEAEELVLWVSDNGVGFDMAYVDKLFSVFERLHYQDEFPGSGVGLAIVRRIAERHGGRVWAEGEPDEGATIFVGLPRNLEVA